MTWADVIIGRRSCAVLVDSRLSHVEIKFHPLIGAKVSGRKFGGIVEFLNPLDPFGKRTATIWSLFSYAFGTSCGQL
jgi:hypothetical protein